MKINRNFDNLVPNYLFADVAKKTNAYIAAHPDSQRCSIGNGMVLLPFDDEGGRRNRQNERDCQACTQRRNGLPQAAI